MTHAAVHQHCNMILQCVLMGWLPYLKISSCLLPGTSCLLSHNAGRKHPAARLPLHPG